MNEDPAGHIKIRETKFDTLILLFIFLNKEILFVKIKCKSLKTMNVQILYTGPENFNRKDIYIDPSIHLSIKMDVLLNQ